MYFNNFKIYNEIFLISFSFVLGLQRSSSQFPTHMDFQKVGEMIFNNEKYNVLKPTVHTIKDYFKQFMLRRNNSEDLNERVFLDDDGLRHLWLGFENKKSLRKTDISDKNINVSKAVTTSDVKTTKLISKLTPRRKKKEDMDEYRTSNRKEIYSNEILRDNQERTVARTTFFCPFFGVITMTSFLD